MIAADLQKMGDSLYSLKTSVEKDAAILTQSDFSGLLQDMVSDLSILFPTSDMLVLQNKLQSQEWLTVSVLDAIIQKFISVKLQYTANKSIYLTDISLQKYKQLLEHKSAMNDLLLKISQTPTAPETIAPVPEVIAPVTEIVDPDVIKTQQAFIDGQDIFEGSWKDDTPETEEEKKSFWNKAKESSFGLAYIFGANNMTTFKEWTWELWDSFKELIGWKKKDKKEDTEATTETVTETTTQTPATPEIVDINTKITPEQVKLRNDYIKKSVMDTTSVPVSIDYAWDKDVLVLAKSPESISFDMASQSIVLGDAKLKLSFPEFTMKVDTTFGSVDATVTKVDIKTIKVSWNEFIIDAKGTWSAMWVEKTQDMSVSLSKEQFYNILQPYLDTNSSSYEHTIDINGEKIPLTVETSWSIEHQPTTTESPDFATYQSTLYNAYTSVDRWHLDDLGTRSKDMYTQATEWLNKERLPLLLQKYDETVVDWLHGKTMAVVAKHFPTVWDVIDDTFLQKIGTTTNDILWWMIDFLSKHEGGKLLGWLAALIKKPLSVLQWLIAGRHGDAQKENGLRAELEKVFTDNPALKKDIEKTTKQFVLVRFYFTEKKSLLAEKWIDVSRFSSLGIPDALALLEQNNILNADISTVTQTGIELNKMAKVVQELIGSTDDGTDYSKERGDIKFNYKTNELESRWGATKINIYEGDKYKIDWFDIPFSDLKSVVWFANLSNRLINEASLTDATDSNHFVYHSPWLKWSWLYVNNRQNLVSWMASKISPIEWWGIDTDKILREGTIEKYMPSWSGKNGDSYAKYLNDRLSVVGKLLG